MRFRFQPVCAAAVVASALTFAPVARAQNNCKTFRAVIQANWIEPAAIAEPTDQRLPAIQQAWINPLPTYPPLPSIPKPPDGYIGWAGAFAGTLDGQFVFGYFTAKSQNPTTNGVSGKEGGVESTLDFGALGSLKTVSDTKGVFPMPPGHAAFGGYSESAKVTEGTGNYQGATGNMSYSGSWLWWPTRTDTSWTAPGSGIWHAEANGRVCIPN